MGFTRRWETDSLGRSTAGVKHGPPLQLGPARAGGDRGCGDLAPSGGRPLRGRPSNRNPLDGGARRDWDGAARPQGRARRSKLDPYETFLRTLIDEKVDITLEEMRARLQEEHGLTVGLGTLWAFLDARDLTYKKRRPTPQSRIGRT